MEVARPLTEEQEATAQLVVVVAVEVLGLPRSLAVLAE